MDNTTGKRPALEDAIAEVIQERMREQGLSENRLAIDVAIPRVTLRRRFVIPGQLTIGELRAIATRLGTTAEEITSSAQRRGAA